MNRSIALISTLVLLLSFDAYAKEFPYIYKGARPLGMGGAFVALSDDANALFYNPAGLANIRETRVSPFIVEIELGEGAFQFNKDYMDLDFDSTKDVGDFLNDYMGDYGHVSTSIFPNYTRPNMAFGVIGSAKYNPHVRDRQYPKLVMDAVGDVGACGGYAHSFLDDSLLVGSNLKYLFRRSIDKEYTVADITTNGFEDRVDDDYSNGSGILLDLGIIYKFQTSDEDTTQHPFQIGLSISNLVGNKLGDATDLDPHIDLGFSKRTGDLTLAADYVDILNQMGDDDDVPKRIHLGIEYAATKTLKLRAGVNQGYFTMGMGMETKRVQLDILSYAEEVGSYSGNDKDRRYLVRFGLVF